MKENNSYIGIATIVGGVCLGVTALIAIFSPEHMTIAPWILGPLAIMGLGLGYLSSKRAVD